jgi:hypothetical protein
MRCHPDRLSETCHSSPTAVSSLARWQPTAHYRLRRPPLGVPEYGRHGSRRGRPGVRAPQPGYATGLDRHLPARRLKHGCGTPAQILEPTYAARLFSADRRNPNAAVTRTPSTPGHGRPSRHSDMRRRPCSLRLPDGLRASGDFRQFPISLPSGSPPNITIPRATLIQYRPEPGVLAG